MHIAISRVNGCCAHDMLPTFYKQYFHGACVLREANALRGKCCPMIVRAIDGRFLGHPFFLHRKRMAMATAAVSVQAHTIRICKRKFTSITPALSVSGPGALCVGPRRLSLSVGASALCVGPRRSLRRAPALFASGFASGPCALCLAPRRSLCRDLG